MKPRFSTVLAAAAASLLWLGATHVFAQGDAPPPPPPPPAAPAAPAAAAAPAPPAGGGDRMEQFRQRMNDRIKSQLKASDDEWAVIQPLLEKVQTKMRETMESRFNGMRGPGGPGGPRRPGNENRPGGNNGGAPTDAAHPAPDANRPRPEGRRGASPEAQALMETLANDEASTNDIKTKLQALREQRKQSEAELTTAREDLKKVLTLRQEAILVSAGMLD